MDSPVLFTVPIPPTAPSQPAGGTITCRMPEQKVYLLTWTAAPDNRMTPAFCKALLDALDLVEFGGYGPADVRECVVVTTSGIPKFYSNGLDLELAIATEGFWGDCLFRLFKRFLTWVTLLP